MNLTNHEWKLVRQLVVDELNKLSKEPNRYLDNDENPKVRIDKLNTILDKFFVATPGWGDIKFLP